jgi:hypothetical protein
MPLLAMLLCMPALLSCITINTTTPSPTEVPPARQVTQATGTLAIEKPMPDERFVAGETVELSIREDREGPNIKWASNLDGNLGTGATIGVKNLSAGIHQITATGNTGKGTVQIRVFKDLSQLYQSKMTTGEINRIRADFNINWMNGTGVSEKWLADSSYEFDQVSPEPSKIVSLARIDVLRHQQFSQPLPFTGGFTAFDNLKSYVKQINLKLDCDISTGGSRTLNLNRNFSVWDSRMSGSSQKPDACKTPIKQPIVLSDYIESIYLLLHEGRHCEPSDPGHITCKGNDNMDQKLEGGSGHATAALYLIWVYKYGLYDSAQTRENARLTAMSILENRFCNTPRHSNPLVQAALNELGIK